MEALISIPLDTSAIYHSWILTSSGLQSFERGVSEEYKIELVCERIKALDNQRRTRVEKSKI